jgi:heme oxygenase
MKQIEVKIKEAQKLFRDKLVLMKQDGGLTRERYTRFLSMQYHLTKGVQKHFMAIAANPLTAKKRNLRKWLINFAQEEEFHFEIAKADLKELGAEPQSLPFDTQLWWNYFDKVIESRPFIRLGATCILENIAEGSSDILDDMIQSSGYLNPKNLRFLIIHRHGPNLAHGDQILEALKEADLTENERADVLVGADQATTFYMRFAHWILEGKELR